MSSPNKHRAGGYVCLLKALSTSFGMSHDFLSTIPLSAAQIWSQRWVCSPSLTRLHQLQSFLTIVATFRHAWFSCCCFFCFFLKKHIFWNAFSLLSRNIHLGHSIDVSGESNRVREPQSKENSNPTQLHIMSTHTHTRARAWVCARTRVLNTVVI